VHLVLWYEVACSALVLLLVGSYLGNNIGIMQFAIPAAFLHLVAIATLGSAAYQLVRLRQADYTEPVLAIQRTLARLRVLRARSNRWLLLSAPLLWGLLIVVVPHGLFAVNVYEMFGVRWVLANIAFGVVMLGAAALVSRRVRHTSAGAALLRWIGDDVTGRRLAEASAALDEIAEFDIAA
jgi:hypothetical protein